MIKIIAIASAKGGVGKSTCSVNLAKAMNNMGYRIGILDADLMGPSIPYLLGLDFNDGREMSRDGQYYPVDVNGIKVISMAMLINPEQALVMRSSILIKYLQAFWQGSRWGKLDYLLIDLPPGTGDVQLTLAQNMNLTAAIIVTTPHGLSREITVKSCKMFEQVRVPILGVIENMSHYNCPHCQTESKIFAKNEAEYPYEILAHLPIDPELSERNFVHIISKIEAKLSKIIVIEPFIWDWQSDEGKPKFMAKSNERELLYIDGQNQNHNIDVNLLRQKCRCAICQQYVPKLADVQPVKIVSIGNYAIKIEWSDNHKSSIYDYDYLVEIATN